MKNILTVFAGRQHNIEILTKYLKKALELKIIDEVHFWNNTRNQNDEIYLETISNVKRTSSSGYGRYIQLFTPIVNNIFSFNVIASNDIHIKILDNAQKDIEYEIVLGGWGNTISVIRKNNIEIVSLMKENIADSIEENTFTVSIVNHSLNIYKNETVIVSCELTEKFNIDDIFVKTGYNGVGHFNYKTIKNHDFYFMDTCEKNWQNYYTYYNDKKYIDDIIIKCDDDIVFIDLLKLPTFIEFIKNNDEYDLVFANIINNGVSAYFQQNKYNLIPYELMVLEYPHDGTCGTLWKSGSKAELLHNYFISNYEKFLDYEYNNDIIPIDTRFSINFFGYKGSKWHKIIDAHNGDDEHNLTVEFVKHRDFKNIFYSDFYVSHLSFYKQIETNINITDLVNKYNDLYDTIIQSGKFNI